MNQFTSGNIHIREMRLFAGEQRRGHAHNFDHTTYCVRGSIRMELLDLAFEPISQRVLNAGEWLLIPKQDRHRITALEDSLAHCIYSHRNAQGEVLQEPGVDWAYV